MASKVAAPKFTELIYGEACHIAHRVELGAHLTGSHSACENLGRTSAQRRRNLTVTGPRLLMWINVGSLVLGALRIVPSGSRDRQ